MMQVHIFSDQTSTFWNLKPTLQNNNNNNVCVHYCASLPVSVDGRVVLQRNFSHWWARRSLNVHVHR